MHFCQTELKHETLRKQEESLEVCIESNTESSSFKPITGRDTTLAISQSISDPSITQNLRFKKQKTAQEETERMFAGEAGLPM